jgi:thymidylate kinase
MFVGMIGSPCSGKTTVAASVFAALKKMGYSVEFISEEARYYIAQAKLRLEVDTKLVLEDRDQADIAWEQYRREAVFCLTCNPKTVVLSDSSMMNAMLYMSTDGREKLSSFVKEYLQAGLYFYCKPVNVVADPTDSNRVHSPEESLLIDQQVEEVLSMFPAVEAVELDGDLDTRVATVLSRILEVLQEKGQ